MASRTHSSERRVIASVDATRGLPPRTGAVVIGAGPYGLATAAHLTVRGVSVRIFGEPMGSWRQMPRGMYLKSTPFASSIGAPGGGSTLAGFVNATGDEPLVGHHPVPLDSFIRYGLWFQERHVPDVDPARVVNVTAHGRGFAVAIDSGEEFWTPNVVVATGLVQCAHVPIQLAPLREDGSPGTRLVSHSSDHTDLSRLAARRVAIIGAGQSALETAALLHESGARVEVFVRGPRVRFASRPLDVSRQGVGTLLKPESPLGPGWSHVAFSYLPGLFRHLPPQRRLQLVATVLGPSGAWWLRERVDGRFPVRLGHRLELAERDDDRVTLTFATTGGEQHSETFDHVVAATGYRVDVDRIRCLDPALRHGIARTHGHWPRLGHGFDSSLPGIYFVGLAAAATFGPLMRFVCGTGFASRRVSVSVARRVTGGNAP